jgi:hypothetical protein
MEHHFVRDTFHTPLLKLSDPLDGQHASGMVVNSVTSCIQRIDGLEKSSEQFHECDLLSLDTAYARGVKWIGWIWIQTSSL